MAARLKVFVTSDGLTDHIVAVSSKAKALAAWGVRQDLFNEGMAHQTDDPGLVKAATAQPGVVLRRATGATAPPVKVKRVAAPAGPSKAALKTARDLEAKLAALDAAQARSLREIEDRKAALDLRAGELRAAHSSRREKLAAALNAARKALG